MKSEFLESIQQLGPFISESRLAKIEKVLEQRTFNIVPVLEHIYDSGNISAVMRSAESFGFVNFQIIDRPDGKFKNSNRVSQGTEKWLNIKKNKSTTQCLNQLKESGFKIYSTHLDATVAIEEIDFTKPTAILFGSEKDGVSQEALDLSDGKFIVPMFGFAQSFNISVAAALCFYHIFTERTKKMGKSGDLSIREVEELKLNYICKSIKGAHKILKRLKT
jgi:tRNA (guanosine-2'-O-)-methyltransferase